MTSPLPPFAGNKASGRQAALWFVIPLGALLFFRFFVLEPFVIPSGSMIPTLEAGDFVVVHKWKYGIKNFKNTEWLLQWGKPRPGEVIVFKSPENKDVYFVKRLLAGPGDRIAVQNGIPVVNGVELEQELLREPSVGSSSRDREMEVKLESGAYTVQYAKADVWSSHREMSEIELGEGEYFVMGDNRDQSSDSRSWGVLPESLIVAPVWAIWWSCPFEENLDPAKCLLGMRRDRVFKTVQ